MSAIQALTQASFTQEALDSPVPVLVEFQAAWCRPCALLAPVIEALAREYAGKVKVVSVNVDEEPTLTARYGIMSVPTLLVFREGAVVRQRVGAAPKAIVNDLIRDMVAPA